MASSLPPVQAPPPPSFAEALSTIPDSSGDYDDFDHRPMVVTNEKQPAGFLETLKKSPLTGRVIAGVSCLALIDIASIRAIEARALPNSPQLDTLLLLDRSPRVQLFWQGMEKIIKETEGRKKAAEKIEELIQSKKEAFFKGSQDYSFEETAKESVEDLERHIQLDKSFLSSDERYSRIREIFVNNRFFYKLLDLTDTHLVADLAKTLSSHKLAIDTLYISNIVEYFDVDDDPEESRTYLCQSLSHLLTPSTLLIDTQPRSCMVCNDLIDRARTLGEKKVEELFDEAPPPHMCEEEEESEEESENEEYLHRAEKRRRCEDEAPKESSPPLASAPTR